MKKITLSLFALMVSAIVSAQTITHSASQDIVGGTIACSGQGAARENSYYRFFDLSTFDITEDYNITNVEFGIENVTAGGSYPITVRLYAATAVFPAGFASMTGYTMLAEQTYDVADQELSIYMAPIEATVPAGSDLVVEVYYFGDDTTTAQVFLGSNDAGQTSPTYIKAAGCGLTTPSDMATIGFPDVHLVLNVTGTSGVAGINDAKLNTVALYPNPVRNTLNIQLPGDVNVSSASITDVTGKKMNANVIDNAVNVSNLVSGVYFLSLETDKGSVTKKFVKE